MQLALLCNKPASWPNSRVRDALPDPLREWLDRQDGQTPGSPRAWRVSNTTMTGRI